MDQSDFPTGIPVCLEIVFLDFTVSHLAIPHRDLSSSSDYYACMPCSWTPVGHLDSSGWCCLRISRTYSAPTHLNDFSKLYHLKVTFHLMACRLSVYTSPASLPNRRKTGYKALLSGVTSTGLEI